MGMKTMEEDFYRLMDLNNKTLLFLVELLDQKISRNTRKSITETSQVKIDTVMLFSQGLRDYDRKDYSSSMEKFKEALKADKELIPARKHYQLALEEAMAVSSSPTELGLVKLLEGDFGKAKEFFSESLAKNSEDIEAMLGMARIDVARNDFQSTRKRLLSILQKEPDNLKALILLGKVNRATGNDKEALIIFEKARGIDPVDLEVRKNLGELYERYIANK